MANTRVGSREAQEFGQIQVGRQAVGRTAAEARSSYARAKRVLDTVLAAVLLLLLWPGMLLVALLVKLDSRGTVLFAQDRVGWDPKTQKDKVFRLYKFRSMSSDCDEEVHREYVTELIRAGNGHSASNDGQEIELKKITDDPRVTRLGKIIRKTSTDELPQLWNVIRGDMSLVGPRPVPPYEVDAYLPWHRQRLEALPGITGLWQVQGRGRVTFDEMARLDIEYIARQSLWFDIQLLVRTIPAVINKNGAA